MNQTCIECGQKSINSNLWCLRATCSLEDKPLILGYGESLADISIKKELATLRTSTLYSAERNHQKVILKVAHLGHEERLKREARFLAGFATQKKKTEFLPQLCAASAYSTPEDMPYSKSVYRGHTRYFSVFEHFDGRLLRDVLAENPQPWFQHVGWIGLSIAEAVWWMHDQQFVHLCLSTESAMVRYDAEGSPRTILVDFGVVAKAQDVGSYWQQHLVATTYTAPELLSRGASKVGTRTDVYGVGSLLYEMLSGTPSFATRDDADHIIRRRILNGTPLALNRPELINLPKVIHHAIQPVYEKRVASLGNLAELLLSVVPPVPEEKHTWHINWQQLARIAAILMVIALLALAVVVIIRNGRLPR